MAIIFRDFFVELCFKQYKIQVLSYPIGLDCRFVAPLSDLSKIINVFSSNHTLEISMNFRFLGGAKVQGLRVWQSDNCHFADCENMSLLRVTY